MKFVFNFQDSATLFAYSLFSMHHDILWYLIIILSLVTWSLWKIITDYGWTPIKKYNFFYKGFGKFILNLEALICYPIFKVYLLLYSYVYNFLIKLDLLVLEYLFTFQVNNFFNQFSIIKDNLYIKYYIELSIYYGLGGIELITGLIRSFPVALASINFNEFKYLIERKYLNLFFIGYGNYQLYMDKYPTLDFLKVQAFKHSTILEYVWAIFPSIIIIIILIPSLALLYSTNPQISPSLTVRVIAHQWYWSYEVSKLHDTDLLKNSYIFDSCIVPADDKVTRLLEVDKELCLPVNVPVRLLVTSGDVLHSWAVPSLGVKMDAIPGRLNEVMIIIKRPGIFYGQCSELCGVSHGFMPIKVRAVSYSEFLDFMVSKIA